VKGESRKGLLLILFFFSICKVIQHQVCSLLIHPCPPVVRYVSHILTRGAKGNSRTYANLL
jgi:hypothetical protein